MELSEAIGSGVSNECYINKAVGTRVVKVLNQVKGTPELKLKTVEQILHCVKANKSEVSIPESKLEAMKLFRQDRNIYFQSEVLNATSNKLGQISMGLETCTSDYTISNIQNRLPKEQPTDISLQAGAEGTGFLLGNTADFDRMTIKEMQFIFKSSSCRSSKQGNPAKTNEILKKPSLEGRANASFVSHKCNELWQESGTNISGVLKSEFPNKESRVLCGKKTEQCIAGDGPPVLASKKIKVNNDLIVHTHDGWEDEWTLEMWQSYKKRMSHLKKPQEHSGGSLLDASERKSSPNPSDSDVSSCLRSRSHVKCKTRQSSDQDEDSYNKHARNASTSQAQNFPFCGTFVLKPKVRLVLEEDDNSEIDCKVSKDHPVTWSQEEFCSTSPVEASLIAAEKKLPLLTNSMLKYGTVPVVESSNMTLINGQSKALNAEQELKLQGTVEPVHFVFTQGSQIKPESPVSVPHSVDENPIVRRKPQYSVKHIKANASLEIACVSSLSDYKRITNTNRWSKGDNDITSSNVGIQQKSDVSTATENHGRQDDSEGAVFQRPTIFPCKRKAISPLSREKLIQATNSGESCVKNLNYQPKLLDSLVARGSSYSKGSSHDYTQGLKWQDMNGETKRVLLDQAGCFTAKEDVVYPTLTVSPCHSKQPSLAWQKLATSSEVGTPTQEIPQKLSLVLSKSPSPPLCSDLLKNSPSPQLTFDDALPANKPVLGSPKLCSKSILSCSLQSCQSACRCEECRSLRNRALKASEFSQQQMQDIEGLAAKLMNELNSMRFLVEDKLLSSNPDAATSTEEVKVAVRKAAETVEMSKSWLIRMARDCNRYCKIMRIQQQRKLTFADESGGQLCQIKIFDS